MYHTGNGNKKFIQSINLTLQVCEVLSDAVVYRLFGFEIQITVPYRYTVMYGESCAVLRHKTL